MRTGPHSYPLQALTDPVPMGQVTASVICRKAELIEWAYCLLTGYSAEVGEFAANQEP